MSLRTFQEKAFQKSLKRLTKTEADLAQIYKSSLTELRSKLVELSEKIDTPTMSNSDLFKYNRLSKLYVNTLDEMKKISSETYNIIYKSNKDMALFAYNGSRDGYSTITSIDIGRVNADTLKSIVEFSYPEVPFKDFVKRLGANGVARLKAALGAGLSQGESIPKLAKRIKEELNKTYNEAVRIARTEGLRANSQAQVEATNQALDIGIKINKIWKTHMDGRERPSHASANGQKADDKGLFHISGYEAPAPRMFNIASEDINCRCTYYEEIIED